MFDRQTEAKKFCRPAPYPCGVRCSGKTAPAALQAIVVIVTNFKRFAEKYPKAFSISQGTIQLPSHGSLFTSSVLKLDILEAVRVAFINEPDALRFYLEFTSLESIKLDVFGKFTDLEVAEELYLKESTLYPDFFVNAELKAFVEFISEVFGKVPETPYSQEEQSSLSAAVNQRLQFLEVDAVEFIRECLGAKRIDADTSEAIAGFELLVRQFDQQPTHV